MKMDWRNSRNAVIGGACLCLAHLSLFPPCKTLKSVRHFLKHDSNQCFPSLSTCKPAQTLHEVWPVKHACDAALTAAGVASAAAPPTGNLGELH